MKCKVIKEFVGMKPERVHDHDSVIPVGTVMGVSKERYQALYEMGFVEPYARKEKKLTRTTKEFKGGNKTK